MTCEDSIDLATENLILCGFGCCFLFFVSFYFSFLLLSFFLSFVFVKGTSVAGDKRERKPKLISTTISKSIWSHIKVACPR